MIYLDAKNSTIYIVINFILILAMSLVLTLLINNVFISSRAKLDKEILSKVSEIRYKEGKDLLKDIDYEDEKSLDKVIGELKNKGYIINKPFYLSEDMRILSIFLSVFISLIINLIININIMQRNQKKYLKSVDKFIGSLIEQDFNVVLDDNGEDMISILNMRFNKMGAAIKRNVLKVREENTNIKNNLADISHQIKTPLTSLSLNNEIILDDENLTDDQIEFLKISQGQISRLKWLTDSLLKISKLDSNTVSFEKKELLAYELVDGFEEDLAIQLESRNLKLVKKGDFNTLLKVDFDWTREAMLNIVKNSTEHAYINTDIIINFVDNSSYSGIEIRNNGPLIPTEEITMLFERFYKSKSNNNKDSIGIGLNLSKKIIQNQGGTIQVFNEEDGVKFSVIFLKL